MPGTSTERTPLLTPKPQPGSSGTITTATSQSPPNLNGGVQDGDGSKRSTAPDTKDDPANLPTARVWAILAANWCAVFLGALDTTIVATLVGPISSSFSSSNQVSWLGTSYLLAIATTTPLYGKLSDIIGRRQASLVALTFFTVGTALCGVAKSMNTLIIARAIAGCGGGGMMTVSSIIASDIIPLKRRGVIQGIVNIFYGLGSALGAPLGGLIVAKYDWRWAFLVQVPFLCVAWLLVFTFVRYNVPGQVTSKRAAFKQVDWLGSATLIVCISGLLLGMSFKNNEDLPWEDPKVWGSLVVFVVFLALFVLVEAKVSPNPVMPLRILSHRSPICIAWSNFLFSMISFIVLYYYPIHFETVQLLEPKGAGIHLVPNAIALSIGSLGAGYIMRRTGKYYYLILWCGALPIAGAIMMAFMDWVPRWTDWVNTLPHGIGSGGIVTTLLIALLANVDRNDMAVATGISYLFRYCGQVVGVGLAGGLLQAVLNSELRQRITGPGAAETIDQIRRVSSSIKDLPLDVRQQAIISYRMALRWVWILNAALACINIVICLFIEEHPLPGSFEEEEAIRKSRLERLANGSEGNSGTATPVNAAASRR